MPFNGMTVALNTSTDRLLKNPATRQLIYDQMMEVVGAANALGIHALTKEFADKMMQMTDEMVPYSPSMKLDYDCFNMLLLSRQAKKRPPKKTARAKSRFSKPESRYKKV
jgi:hypothetical protein